MSFPRYENHEDVGIEWLGDVPGHWEVLSLGKVTIDKCDGPFGSGLKSEHYADDGVRVVRLQNIKEIGFDGSDAAFIEESYYQRSLANHDVVGGDVLIAGLGDDKNTVGRACVAPTGIEPAMVKADCFRFRLNKTRASARFVATQLSAGSRYDAGMLSSGSTRSRIPLSLMATRKIALPPICEQNAITAFLDRETGKIDALVTEQQRLIELLKEKRQAVISHAVTKGIDPHAPMKDIGVEWIGEVPAHWSIMQIKRLAKIKYGLGEPPKYRDEGTSLIRATNVDAGHIRAHGLVFIDPADLPENRIIWLAPGDIIVVRSGAYTGDSAIIRDEHCPCIAGFDMVLRVHGCASDFLQFALLSCYLKRGQLDLEKLRAAQPHLNAEELGASFVLLPPKMEQLAIVCFLQNATSKLDLLMAEAESAVALLQERRAALISAAVTGKIDVRGLVAVKAEAA